MVEQIEGMENATTWQMTDQIAGWKMQDHGPNNVTSC